MAERKARCRCETEIIKLKASAESVTALTVVVEDERKPDVSHLGRKINVLKTNWTTFETCQGTYFSQVTDQTVADEVKRMYEEQMDMYTQALDKGELFKAGLQQAGPTPLTGKEKVKVCLAKRASLTVDAERILGGFFEILEDNASVPGRAVLQAQLDMLEEVKQKMLEADKMTAEAVEMDYGQAAVYPAEGQTRGWRLESRFRKLRISQPA